MNAIERSTSTTKEAKYYAQWKTKWAKVNQATTNKARGGQSKLIPRKEGWSLQKVAQTRSKECNHKEEDIWKPWTSFTSNRQGLKTTYFSQSCAHSCQCPRTDTQIGRGECFRETAKTAEDGSSYGKDGSGRRESGPHRFYFLYFPQPFCKKTYFLYFPHPFCKKGPIN